jgi:hypothetical protein
MGHLPVATMGAGVARPATIAAAVHPSAGLAGHAVGSIDEARAHRQLDVIATTTTDFVRAGIVHWLIGGWAVDFHLGRISRNHSDVDVALWVTDRELAARVLTRRGLRLDHSRSSEGVERFVSRTDHVTVTYLGLAADGSVVTPGFEHWPYQPRSFGEEHRTLRGVRATVTSAAALFDTKCNWEREVGEPPRPHDLADIEALRAIAGPCARPPRHQPAPHTAPSHRLHHEDRPCT